MMFTCIIFITLSVLAEKTKKPSPPLRDWEKYKDDIMKCSPQERMRRLHNGEYS